jgi:hypothetical protein
VTTKIKSVTSDIIIQNQKKSIKFENKLKTLDIKYRYLKNSYIISEINDDDINIFINILAWEIINSFNVKIKFLDDSYSENFVNYVNKNPFITIYVKDKLTEYFMNDNSVIDIEKFIKYNLHNLNSEYEKLLDKIDKKETFNKYILKSVLFNDDRLKNVKELNIRFISYKDINDFDCEITTDNNLKINSLLVDSTIRLYNLSPSLKSSKSIMKNEMNAAVATIISICPAKVNFSGKYNKKIVNNIIKEVSKNCINNIDYELK